MKVNGDAVGAAAAAAFEKVKLQMIPFSAVKLSERNMMSIVSA